MRKQIVGILTLIIILLVVLVSIEWLKVKEERTIYGMKLSFSDDQQRSFTWLSGQSYPDSLLQIKPTQESWDNGNVMEQAAWQSVVINDDEDRIYTYRAEIDGLEWGQSYSYRVVVNGEIISDEYRFSVAEQQSESFQFIHVTDTQGTTEGDFKQWGDTLKQSLKQAPNAQFIIHGGDITDDPSNVQQWKWFYHQAPMLSSLPFLATTGNHELVNDDAQFFQAQITFPANGASGLPNYTSYYSSYQNALFIFLNTEDDIKKQTKWLEQVLQYQADQYDWIIVSMHRGLYGASQFKDAEDWEQLFDQYGVDLVLQGHNHSYSRSFPLRDGKVVDSGEQGTVYVTLNAAGSKLNDEKKEKNYQAVAFQNGKSMFGVVELQSSKLIYSAYDDDGQLLDQFTLAK